MKKVSRRNMMVAASAGIGVSALGNRAHAAADNLETVIQSLPNISGHEHWGAITAVGQTSAGFRCDLVAGAEPQNASLFDLLFDPYSGMHYGAMGVSPNTEAKTHGFPNAADWGREKPAEAWEYAREILKPIQSTGWYTCTAKGIEILHGVSLNELLERESGSTAIALELNQQIRERYRSLMDWYARAYRTLHIETILRPAELEFGFHQENPAERKLMAPLLRIDQFCDYYRKREKGAIKFCVEHTGIEPKTADDFRSFLAKCFDAAEASGFVGTKQLQAYSRPLDFMRPKDSDVLFEPTEDRTERRRFGDFIVYECMELAAKRGWCHQVHTGTHNHPHSNPLPLEKLIRTFRQVNFVLIHCWPYISESAYLAIRHPNVYLDTCWTPVLNPAFFRREMDEWIGYVPDTKVTIGHDSTSVEMAAGSAYISRTQLTRALQERIRDGLMTEESAIALASNYLAENARRVYSLQ